MKRFWSQQSDIVIQLSENIHFNYAELHKNKLEFTGELGAYYKSQEEYTNLSFFLGISPFPPFSFAAFAYSNYRLVESKQVSYMKEYAFPALKNAATFSQSENPKLTINQWLTNNLSKRDIASQQKDIAAAKRYQQNIHDIEKIISEIIGYEITFGLQLEPLNLVIKTEKATLDFDVLPDGLRSLISWIGNLLMRMDNLKWENDLPISERRFFLFLDEIEVHLHPEWQKKILPIVQKLFKNAQIFISTHSPFIINSVDNAWVHEIELCEGKVKVNKPVLSNSGDSYMRVLREVFGINETFGGESQLELGNFYQMRNQILASANGIEHKMQQQFLKVAKKLASRSIELNTIVQGEIRQINRIKQTNYSL
jgi:predicted ATP-binding protein involved in virulence